MTHTGDYWAEVEALFYEALDVEPSARPALLEARAAGREAVRAEVESLLDAHALAEHAVQRGAPVPGGDDAGSQGGPARIGSTIGPFRLVETIGAGGMGTVYRAERSDGDFDQQVAVKVIAAPISHAATARRFRAERQILASLRHPHIVTLLDGGVTADGLAYLVMEYVEGVPISQYCEEHALSLDERLRLFRQVCAAVHHAHRHFVVHRDLKPANILVTADGVPKILDFGVAKLLDDPDAAAAVTVTAPGGGPMTPNYASPEQLRGLPVTTSSDVYALGVLLYELVTGTRPYETAGKPLDEVLHLVVDDQPRRPSAAVAGVDDRRRLRGDIDAIVLRAMSKEPERRYGSADELGDDVARYLEGRPVQAREPSFGYVIRKLAARHRGVFVSAAVSVAVIVSALAIAVWQARVATVERRRAEHRFNEVRALANTLIFKIHDAVAPLPGSTPVRQTIVTEALGYLERLAPDAHGDPALQRELARAYVQIGKVQGAPSVANLGDRAGAVVSFDKALAILRPRSSAPDAPYEVVSEFVEAGRRLSETLNLMDGQQQRSRQVALETVAAAASLERRHPADDKVRSLIASANFTAAVSMDAEASLVYWNRAKAAYQALLADRPEDAVRQRNVALVEKYLGTYYFDKGDYATALACHERARALDEQRLAADPSNRQTQLDVAFDLGNLGHVATRQGDLARAADFYERSLSLRKQLSDTDPHDDNAASRTAFAHSQLAEIYSAARDLPRAYGHGRAAVALLDARPQPTTGTTRTLAFVLKTFGGVARDRGQRAEGCAAFQRAFELMQALGEQDRSRGIDVKIDPLPQVAAEAAACGDKGAQEWLAADSVSR